MSQKPALYLYISKQCEERLSALRTPIAKLTYLYLCRYASRSDTGLLPRGTTNVSEQTLCELVGCSDRSIRTAISTLKEAGLIETIQRYNTSNLTKIPDLLRETPAALPEDPVGTGCRSGSKTTGSREAADAGPGRKAIRSQQEDRRNQLPPKSIEEIEEKEEKRQEEEEILFDSHVSIKEQPHTSENDCDLILPYYCFLVSPLNETRVNETKKPEVRAALSRACQTVGVDAVRKALFCYYDTYGKDSSKDPKFIRGLGSLLSDPTFTTPQKLALDMVAEYADSFDTFTQTKKENHK